MLASLYIRRLRGLIHLRRGIPNCDEYYGFLGELKKLHDKVDSGDLSDFTELKL